MTRRIVKWFTLLAGVSALLLMLLAAGLYWRLTQGPLALPMLAGLVREALHEGLDASGLRLRFRDVVAEIDRDRLPTLRLRDMTLENADGHVLATAPRAAVALSGADLLRGRVRVKRLKLVGPHLSIVRRADGTLRIGIRRDVAQGGGVGRQGATPQPAVAPKTPAGGMPVTSLDPADFLRHARATAAAGKGSGANDALGGLESLRISRAVIDYRDERLNALWHAPDAEITLRRVPYGYAMLATARVRGAGENAWRIEASASWRRGTGRTIVSVQVQDLRLGELLSGITSINRLTRLDIPASGRLAAELDGRGRLRKASAELLLGAGRMRFPDYIAHPLDIREGMLRLGYDPDEGRVVVENGRLMLKGGEVLLKGDIRLHHDAKGTLRSLGLALDAATRTPSNRPMLVRKVRLRGRAWPDNPRLDIDDLQFFGIDDGAIRLRGVLRAENAGMGIYVSGRARAISHRLLRELWPPAVGAGARKWLRENVRAGTIPKATFRLAIPAAVLRAAIREDRPMPEKVADVRFDVRGVRFTHVDGWPAIADAAGEGSLNGNVFRIRLTRGVSRLPSGRALTLAAGEMTARDLAARVSPGRIRFTARGRAGAFLELADLPPLRLASAAGVPKDMLSGDAEVKVELSMPLSRNMTGRDVKVEKAVATVRKARIAGLVKNLVMTRAEVGITFHGSMLQARGRGSLLDVPVRFSWQRDLRESKGRNRVRLQARLDDATRRRLGIDLSPWLSGPIPLDATVVYSKRGMESAEVSARLDAVAFGLPAIGWHRPPRKGTKASFVVNLSLDARDEVRAIAIRRLKLSGPGGLHLQGKVNLGRGGVFRDATFSRFELDSDNRLALGVERARDRLDVVAAGPSFDARPLIRRLFATRREIDRSLRDVRVRVNISRVLTLRGEWIRDVRGSVHMRDGLVRQAELAGRFASSDAPVRLDLKPATTGLRRLRITTTDAGALLRASGLYSRMVGGRAEFTALLEGGDAGGVRRGLLEIRRFAVRGDERLERLRKGGKGNRGPRRVPRFKKLVLPFSTDSRFIRIGDAIIRSPEIGATANGMIRRSDGAMDIGGVIIPAYALNAALGKIPVLGALLTGGRGEGIFGMTYALKGTMSKPKFLVNPLSTVAPGVFRQLFHLGGQNVNPDGTPRRRGQTTPKRRRSNNLVNGG